MPLIVMRQMNIREAAGVERKARQSGGCFIYVGVVKETRGG